MINYYSTRDLYFWAQKVLLPYSLQQSADTKKDCKEILAQIRTEYNKRNPSTSNSDDDDDDDNDDDDDDLDSFDKVFYNDDFRSFCRRLQPYQGC